MASRIEEFGELKIEVEAHVPWAKGIVHRFAEKLGFEGTLLSEIDICVTELLTNLVLHKAKNGRVSFQEITENGLRGIEILVQDEGPGIKNVDRALKGGASTGGSLGQGLASVQRFADEFEIHSNSDGTRIRLHKYLPPPKAQESQGLRELSVSVSVRTHPESNICGDGHMIHHDGPKTLLAVIDGLGHGENARVAAGIAEAYLHANYRKPLEKMPEELHHALQHSRGAVVGIIRIDESKDLLSFIGIGNISVRLWLPDTSSWVRPVSMSGTLGVSFRTPRMFYYPWEKGSLLVMHSDGLREHWELSSEERTKFPTEIARHLMENYWRRTDDATVMVAK